MAIDEMKLTPEKFSSVEKIFSRFLNPSMAQFWSYSLARNMEAIEFFQKQYCQEKDVVYEQ